MIMVYIGTTRNAFRLQDLPRLGGIEVSCKAPAVADDAAEAPVVVALGGHVAVAKAV